MKANITHREKLTDFIKDFSLREPRRVRKNTSRSYTLQRFQENSHFRQSNFEPFSSRKNNSDQSQHLINGFWDPLQSIRKFDALPLMSYSEEPVVCPECGHLDLMRHGPAESKVLGGLTFRWKCNLCGSTFRWDIAKGLKYPLPLWEPVICCFLEGNSLKKINEEVKKEASRLGLCVESVSSDAVNSIVRRTCHVGSAFEKLAVQDLTEKEVKLKRVEIDFSPYILYTPVNGEKQFTLEKKPLNFGSLTKSQVKHLRARPAMAYLTGAIVEESRYMPSVITGRGFNYRYSLKCLWKMLDTIGSKPEVIICDGFKGHVKAVKILLPDVKLISRTKNQYYGIVNYLERAWGEFKTECLHKYRFRSFNTLPYAVELKRLQHNLLRPHTSLNGLTPAEYLKIRIPRSIVESKEEKWQKLLKLAYHMVTIEKAVNKRKRLKKEVSLD